MSTKANVVMKKAVPYCILPCLSDPFRNEEIRIPIEMTVVMIVNGSGIYILPAARHSLVPSSEGRLPKGHVETHVCLYNQ